MKDMKDAETVSVRHGTAVLVRNGSNDCWVLRTADKIDGSWVNEARLATTEGEFWRCWTPYEGFERLEGTRIPFDGKWHSGDMCAFEDEGRIRIGFFCGFEAESGNALVSPVPVQGLEIGAVVQPCRSAESVPASSLRRPEELWSWWTPKLYAEMPDPNPFASRIVPV